jgi:hypothetical protein
MSLDTFRNGSELPGVAGFLALVTHWEVEQPQVADIVEDVYCAVETGG